MTTTDDLNSRDMGLAELLSEFDVFNHSHFARMPEAMDYARRQCPVAHSNAHGGLHLISRYAELKAVLADPETFSSRESPTLPTGGVALPPFTSDPPLHNQFRKIVNRFFTRPYLRRHEDIMREIARSHIERFVDRGEVELMEEFALPFTSAAVAQIVFDEDNEERLKRIKAAVELVARVNTPEKHYLLIHYDIPQLDAKAYQLKVGGLVNNKLTLDMDTLRSMEKVTLPATMECCGNGRASQRWRLWAHVPWNHDAIGTAEWTGTPLRGLLEQAGVQDNAVEILFTGKDKGIQGPPDGAEVQHFQRSLTVDYAMDPANDVLLCYEINGQPLPPQHGFPLRLLVPGWLGMTNVKWIDSIEAIDWRLTKNQMKWYSYAENDEDPNRIPATFEQVRAMMIPPGIPDFLCRIRHLEETDTVELRGRAWAGGLGIEEVDVSLDGGDTWLPAKLDKPFGKWAWVGWSFTWENVTPGQYLLRCRAKDERGSMSKPDDFAHDYYAMDNTKPQCVDVNVYPKGTLTVGNHIAMPVQFPSL